MVMVEVSEKQGFRQDYNHSRPRGGYGGGFRGIVDSNIPPRANTKSSESYVELDLPIEIEEDIALWREMAVIGRFIGAKITRMKTRDWVKENSSQDVVLKFILKGFFIVVFKEETVRNKILKQQNWLCGWAHLYLQPLQSSLDIVPLAVYKEPIWIQLYNLPMEYWGDFILECIGRSLGTLLAVDEEIIENDSYLYARIKIVAVKKVPPIIYLKAGERCWKQQVEVEQPSPCRERSGLKDQVAEDFSIFVKPAKKWIQKEGDHKLVIKIVSPEQEIQQNPASPMLSKGTRTSREGSRSNRNVGKGVENNPQLRESLSQKKG
ncbi:hypothetical protein SUGI_0075720 [Cryptomeria japonica]|nr:hypothetical protein SUGI_0075720 [Cryptomeria japonica]